MSQLKPKTAKQHGGWLRAQEKVIIMGKVTATMPQGVVPSPNSWNADGVEGQRIRLIFRKRRGGRQLVAMALPKEGIRARRWGGQGGCFTDELLRRGAMRNLLEFRVPPETVGRSSVGGGVPGIEGINFTKTPLLTR